MATTVSGTGSFDEYSKINEEPKLDKKAGEETSQSVFSKYDTSQDGTIDTYEQRDVLLNKIIKKYHELQIEFTKSTVAKIEKIFRSFNIIKTDGTSSSAESANSLIDNLTENRIEMLLRMDNGRDCSEDYRNVHDFYASKNLQEGDYYITKEGECHIYDGNKKLMIFNWLSINIHSSAGKAKFVNAKDDKALDYAIQHGRDRSNEYTNIRSFENAEDLQPWDYYKKGDFMLIYNGTLMGISILNPNVV